MKIGRILFWFQNGSERSHKLSEKFFGLSTLLQRLINQIYDGKGIKFVNIDFCTEETYALFPAVTKYYVHYHTAQGGHLRYYGLIDFELFNSLSYIDQKRFLWEYAHNYLKESAIKIGNDGLLSACEIAYKKGIETDLNMDYKVLETQFDVKGQKYDASVVIHFFENEMSAEFILEASGFHVFSKEIDKTVNGVEFFLEMFASIKYENGSIIIDGARDVDYFPLRINIPR
jgi:hypothetical protein